MYTEIWLQLFLEINILFSGDQVKKTEMGRICSTYGVMRSADRFLVGKPEGRRPLERPRRRWGGGISIKMDLREVG
jgi:hypothetical protein